MPARSIRVLVAEDYPPFRRYLASALQGRQDLQIICEVADGLEAVEKAEELQPELVLLDIGLPTLNGIEAARRIRCVSPYSRILFVSQESSADIVQAALETGAGGYVVKADAGRELMAALDAVLRGETYKSRSLFGHEIRKASDRLAIHQVEAHRVETHRVETHPGSASHRQKELGSTREHKVGFYFDDRSLLDGFTHFLGSALKSGSAAIVIATELRRDKILGRLHAYGLDMTAAIQHGRYTALDNQETLSRFMVNGLPDPDRFHKATRDLIARTAKSVNGEHARIAACGECAPLLWEQGNADGAVRLEHLWDGIATSYGLQVLCGYSLASFQGGAGSYTFGRICAEHSAVVSY
jgi:DNA-binding NarL/FixJ family response regulator